MEDKAEIPRDQTGTNHIKSVAGPKRKLIKVEGSVLIPVASVIKDKRIKIQTVPVRLPIPNQAILHQSGPLRGNVRIIDSALKTKRVTRAEPSISCAKT